MRFCSNAVCSSADNGVVSTEVDELSGLPRAPAAALKTLDVSPPAAAVPVAMPKALLADFPNSSSVSVVTPEPTIAPVAFFKMSSALPPEAAVLTIEPPTEVMALAIAGSLPAATICFATSVEPVCTTSEMATFIIAFSIGTPCATCKAVLARAVPIFVEVAVAAADAAAASSAVAPAAVAAAAASAAEVTTPASARTSPKTAPTPGITAIKTGAIVLKALDKLKSPRSTVLKTLPEALSTR